MSRSRRDAGKLIGLACASALLHQHQRQITDGHVYANDDDIALAKWLATGLTGALSPKLADVAAKLRAAFGPSSFTASEASDTLGCAPDAARRHLRELENLDLVEVEGEKRGNVGGRWRFPSSRAAMPIIPNWSGHAQPSNAPAQGSTATPTSAAASASTTPQVPVGSPTLAS